MKHESSSSKPPAPARRTDQERDDENERRRFRARRVSAAQLAAPSGRTWRRAGRFSSAMDG